MLYDHLRISASMASCGVAIIPSIFQKRLSVSRSNCRSSEVSLRMKALFDLSLAVCTARAAVYCTSDAAKFSLATRHRKKSKQKENT